MTRRLFCTFSVAAALWADGGKVQFQRKAGAFDITLFSTPATIRSGKADLSVMVQKASDQSNILDATVSLHLVKRQADSIAEVIAPATHQHATNKLLYAAAVDFATPGRWRIEITVDRAAESALVSGDLDVLPPEPPLLAHWPYFALLPLTALLFAFNRWLKRNRG